MPTLLIPSPVGERRIEAAPQAVLAHHVRVCFADMPDRRQYDLRREGQRCHGRPRGDGAVIRSVRDATCRVVVEAPLDTADPARGRAGLVAGGDAPAVFAVTREVVRVVDRVLLLRKSGAVT